MAARLGPLAQAGPVEQAIAFGDVVVMVVPYAALEEIGRRTVAPSPASHWSWTSAIRSRGATGRPSCSGSTSRAGRGWPAPSCCQVAHRARVQRDQLSEAGRRRPPPQAVLSASRSQATISRPSPSPKGIRTIGFEPVLTAPREGQIPAPRHAAGRGTRPRRFERSPPLGK